MRRRLPRRTTRLCYAIQQRSTLAWGCLMVLIIWYVGLVAIGDGLAYLIGRVVEYSGAGSYTSMITFLALYFLTLWVAWVLAVRLTEPKKIAS
jgi:hypothetical protein